MRPVEKIERVKLICHEVRRRILKTVLNAGSGHLGGCLSSVELMVVLYLGGILKFDPSTPRHPYRDRVLVRGHLGPLRYSLFSLLGWVEEQELALYRSFGSRLHGHESMEDVPGVDITPSGMLGMLLSYGVGSAITLKEQEIPATVWVFLGDGEEQEGNISEAARHASNIKLTNLIGVIDRNKKQLSQLTSEVDGSSNLTTLWRGYGWSVREIQDGHSIIEILHAFQEDRAIDKPTLFIANTVKSKGLRGAEEHPSGYHTISTCPKGYITEAIAEEEEVLSSVTPEEFKKIVSEVIKQIPQLMNVRKSSISTPFHLEFVPESTDVFEDGLVSYFQKLTVFFQTRQERFYVLTADVTVKDLARQCGFGQGHVRYLDVGIREQHLISMAHGISVTDPNSRILIVEGDPFLFRAMDQLHAVAQAGSKMIIIGADSGVCEARNGPTHQTTGQPGTLLNMPGLTVFEPADVVDLTNCLNWAFTEYPGPVYLRLHSGIVSCLPVDGKQRNLISYTTYESLNKPCLVIVASGLLVDEAMKLAMKWDDLGVGIKVVNVINMKELGRSFVNLLEQNTPVLTVYNGNPFVLQSAVAKAVMESEEPRPSVIRSHGFTLGTTGRLEDLLKYFRLDADGIEEIIKQMFPRIFS